MSNSVLAKMAIEITANTAKFNSSLSETNKKLDSFSKGITGIGKSLIAGLGLYEVGRGIIDVTAKFQKFEAILTNTLGNSSAAQKALRDIEAFAQNTPFQVDEVTAAYVRWANQGLDPTIDRMGKLGDVASSLGAGFEQTAEAFKDLLVGQTKRIEEVGISATQMNGKIQLSFKGVNIEVEKSAEGVQKALDVYSQLNGVLGTSEAISKTLGGRISNLKDSWDLLLKTIGEANSGPLFTTINVLTRLTQGLAYIGIQAKITAKGLESLTTLEFEKVFNFGETESLKKISDVIKEINSLGSNAFFKDIEANKKKFIDLLMQEGESQKDVLILWEKYVDLRIRAGNIETDTYLNKKKTVEVIKEETKAVKELNLERQKAQARADAQRGDNFKSSAPNVAGFDTTAAFVDSPLDGIDSMTSAYDGLTASIARLNEIQGVNNEKTLESQAAWLAFGLSAAGAISQAIEADLSLGKSIANVTADILASSAQRISAFLGEGIAKAFAINPIAGAAIAAIGLGAITGLLRKVGNKGNSGGGYSRPSSSSYAMASDSQSSVSFRIRGEDLVGTINNYNKNGKYTYAGG